MLRFKQVHLPEHNYTCVLWFLVLIHNDHVHIQLVIDKVVRSPEKLCGFPRTRMPEEVIWQLSRTDFCYIKKIHNIMNESLLRRVAPPIFRCFYGKKYFARILLREPMGNGDVYPHLVARTSLGIH